MNRSFIEALKDFVQNTFGLREGETLRALLMQANIFLLISTLLMVKPTANALFLDKIGVDELPIAFILVAISAAIISTFYSRGLNNRSLSSIIYWTLYSSIFVLIIFGLLLRLNFLEGWILYLFYIWVSLFAVLSASQFWIMANLVFNAREAKRLFGFIGAGAIAGGIFGGYLTTLLAPMIGSENLLFVCATFLALCIPIVRSIWRRGQVAESAYLKHEKRVTKPSKHPFKLIVQSKHLSFLASIIGVSVIVAKLVDYQFSAMAAVAIIDPDELTAFFGFWFSTFNLVSLLIQLFLTARIVGVLGVGTSLLFLPGGILFGAILLFFIPELWAAIFIKLADGSLKQSINKAGIELIALPIPSIIKNQTKTYIDVFIDSVATGISGLILIFVISALNLSTLTISVIIAVLVCIWIYFVIKIKGAYLESFRQKVDEVNELPSGNKVKLDNQASILGGLSKVLKKGSEKQIIFALKKLKEIQDERLYQAAKQLLKHPSADIRALALQTLYYFKNQPLLQEAYALTNDPTQKVKIAAFQYLIEHHEENIFELVDRFLNDPDEKVSTAALISLAKETRDNYVLKSRFGLENRIQIEIKKLEDYPTEKQRRFHHISLLKAIGYADLPSFYPFIQSGFSHPGRDIVLNAIQAAGYTTSKEMIPYLMSALEEDHLAATAIEALALYGQGIISVLDNISQTTPLKTKAIKEFPKILEQFPTQGAVDVLFRLLDWQEGNVRLAALRALNKLKKQSPHLNYHQKDILIRITEEARTFKDTLSILYVQNSMVDSLERNPEQQARQQLVALLEKRLDRHLERIFRLLGLKYPPDDVLNIYNSLHSQENDHRVTALEFLDNLLENNLKKVLIPIIETALLDAISAEAIRELKVKIPNEEECFGLLLNEADLKVKLAVLALLATIPKATYRKLIESSTNNPHEKVRQTARKILQNLDEKA